MHTKVYLIALFATASIGVVSLTSCLKKQTTCQCSFSGGGKNNYDMRAVDNMQDSCITLSKQAELNNGRCFLK